MKLPFDNDSDTQDGEVFDELRGSYGETQTVGYAAFENNILYYSSTHPHSHSNGTTLIAYNYESGQKSAYFQRVGDFFGNIRMKSDDKKIIFTYELFGSGQSQGDYAIVFDKVTFKFGEPYKVEETQ